MKQNLVKIWSLILFIVMSSTIYGQEERVFIFEEEVVEQAIDVREFDQESLDEYSNSRVFDFTEVEQSESPVGNMISRFFSKLFNGIGKGLSSNVFQYLMVITMIAILAWFLKSTESSSFVSGANSTVKRYVEELDIRVDENILLQKMKDSESKQSYREALRYAYLLNLKSLNEADKIIWQEHKLSTDYLEELEDTSLQEEFASMTKYFNFGWYGKRTITEEMYDKIKYTYTKLSEKITKRH